jgi:imidazolonepropionase-like amidohydrolase
MVLVVAVGIVIAACTPTAQDTTTSTAAPTTTTSAPTTTSTATTTTTEPIAFADLVYTGGDIVTMDPAIGTVESIAITGDTITAVGENPDIAPYIGPDTAVVELDGNTVQPGFVDAHTHVLTDMGGIEVGQKLALAAGITSLGDASIEPGLAEEFIAASDSGLLKIRTSLYFARTDPCGADQGTWYEEFPAGAELADRVRVGGV